MFNLAQVYQDADAFETAKLRKEMFGNQMAEQQKAAAQADKDRALAERERAKAAADEAAIRSARGGAWGGDDASLAKLATYDPREAAALVEFRDSRIKAGKDAEVAAMNAKAEQVGKAMAWIKSSPDQGEAQARWQMARENLDDGDKLPEQFDPRMVDFMLARAMDTDSILSQGRSDKAQAAMSSAFAPQTPDPRGRRAASPRAPIRPGWIRASSARLTRPRRSAPRWRGARAAAASALRTTSRAPAASGTMGAASSRSAGSTMPSARA